MPRDTHTALLNAAQERFATQGYAATSIRSLAAAVGIKESSVYNHFPSKRALLEAVLGRAEQRAAALAEKFHVSLEDPDSAADIYAVISPDQLDKIAAGFLDLWLHDLDFVAARRILTLEQYRTPEAAHMLHQLTVERPLAQQAALFQELISRRFFHPADPECVALAFWGPILAILVTADAPNGEAKARRRLSAHLAHFRATHVRQS